ncbi:MAG: long-chain-fatty-acid--CoA ligase [Actinobacteria bacterium]|nr:MAG: long-chain-fatty-acid--CoA ligase [Actinomycetota bacterium]
MAARAATTDRPQAKAFRSELSPVSFLRRSAYVFPDKVAVVHGQRRVTYAEFDERVNRLASALIGTGVAPGERVAFLAPNIPALLEAHYGVPAAGAVLVPINTRLGVDEVSYILEHSGTRMVFADHELAHLVQDCPLPVVRIDDTGLPGDPYEDFLASGSAAHVEHAVADEEQTISINYTSGTTGRPKGVMYTYRGAYLNSLLEALQSHLRPESVQLWVVPMFHCNGWCFTWAVTAVGARHVCLRKVDAGAMWELFEREGITHYNAAPTVHLGVVTHPSAHRLERGLTVAIGGAPPSPTLLAKLSALNFIPVHVYGLTETYGPYTVCEPQEEWGRLSEEERALMLGRQGVHNIVADPIRVVDAEMHDVPRDGETMGEVVMRGNNVMKGYFEDPEATALAFAGGWFHSGDVGVMHADGYIELRDRKKDIIISGGENISTIEVENTICSHPAVLECAVVAIPDERWGERPKAFVALAEGQRASEQEIIDYCRERLARFKAPVAVEFGELPKTSTGKVQKYRLREREWAGREKRVN